MKRAALCLLVVVLTGLAGCNILQPAPTPTVSPSATPVAGTVEPVTPTPTSSPTPPPTATPTPSPTPTPPAVAPTSTPTQVSSAYLGVVRQGGRLGAVWTLADVRFGLHPGWLRVVWEMTEPGDHLPLFKFVEVDNAADPFPTGHDPSWGAARIDLVVSDLYAYDFPLGQRLPLIPPDNPRVTRIGTYPTFSDAHLGFSIGLKAPSAYKVYELTKPVRIVIDVLYDD